MPSIKIQKNYPHSLNHQPFPGSSIMIDASFQTGLTSSLVSIEQNKNILDNPFSSTRRRGLPNAPAKGGDMANKTGQAKTTLSKDW